MDTTEKSRELSTHARILIALIAFVGIGALAVGALATTGCYGVFVPQFTVIIFNGLGHTPAVALTLTAVGGFVVLGLVAYAIYLNRRRTTPHHTTNAFE